jgi:hypothetical protein
MSILLLLTRCAAHDVITFYDCCHALPFISVFHA